MAAVVCGMVKLLQLTILLGIKGQNRRNSTFTVNKYHNDAEGLPLCHL
jgi:hypothetical protein